MASAMCDIFDFLPSDDHEFEEMEISEVDQDLLLALLEASEGEWGDDERLGNIMRSVEAEIGDSKDLVMDDSTLGIDMEMGSMSYEEMSQWYPYSIENENFDMIEFENNFRLYETFAGVEVEECSQLYYNDEHVYSSLWQETYDPVM